MLLSKKIFQPLSCLIILVSVSASAQDSTNEIEVRQNNVTNTSIYENEVTSLTPDEIIDPILAEWGEKVSSQELSEFGYSNDLAGRAEAIRDFKISFETNGVTREDLRELEKYIPGSLDKLTKLPPKYKQVHLILDSFVVDKAHQFISNLAGNLNKE